MIIFGLTVLFSVKVPSFILFLWNFLFFFLVLGGWFIPCHLDFLLFIFLFSYFFYWGNLGYSLGVIRFLMVLSSWVREFVFMWFWLQSLFFLQIVFLVSSILLLFLLFCYIFRRVSFAVYLYILLKTDSYFVPSLGWS